MNLDRAKSLALLCLKFARVERVTRHEDGKRPETDTDHTVMLSVIACDFCPDSLDRGKVAQFALVHDLLEADTGDVQTLTIDVAGRAAKADAERAALERFRVTYGTDSWLVSCIEAYERQDTPEARYVRVMDKVMPKITHLFNGCIAAKNLTDQDGFYYSHSQQLRMFSRQFEKVENPEAWVVETLDLLHAAMVASEKAWGQDS